MSSLGALMGDQVGSNFGFGGLGLIGSGRGGGGLGVGSMGAYPEPPFEREAYEHIDEVGLRLVAEHPLSTFSIDVDTASYSNTRRFLSEGRLPPPDAVRIEEMINYFEYDYAPPAHGAAPFSVHTEVGPCPWNSERRLLHVGIQARRIDQADVPPRNLVFLLDVSGSMGSADKLPLLLSAMNLLVDNLRPVDRVAIVVYAGAAGLVLPSTPGTARPAIRDALARLQAGGSTDGGAGIQLAYDLARQHFIRGGINRVVLATDGDFNVGTTSHGDLTRLIEEQRQSGVFLSVLGFGTGNLQDHTMETLADHGNGNYAYIDTIAEARRVLVRTAGGTLVTIAKDVKLQLEFNPERVASYRLIGYDNRRLRDEEFNDDARDAGEIGAGHSVTALYEFVPASTTSPNAANSVDRPPIDPLRYQGERAPSAEAASDELATAKIRYKRPDGETSILLSRRVRDRVVPSGELSPTFRFSAAVAAFGMVLRGSEHRGSATFDSVRRLAQTAIGRDPHGDRRELIRLIDSAEALGPDATR
ncbi:MAG: hypothetical protein DRJ42_25535 [Deltaproteobacteria bacterium]|nr:MAG: hypothetical protein DRJ42_25535 [Deltaproteobacteria bacterium]